MITLIINTTSSQSVSVGLQKDGHAAFLTQESTAWKSQAVLPLIEKILKQHSITFADLDNIEVALGPGSFTGLRVGVAIANTLGTQLQIPINNNPVGQTVEPVYQ